MKGVFWRMMPHRSFFFKDKVFHGVKEPKDRFTALLTVSMVGEKVKPMIVGKSQLPRSFPKSNFLPNFYYAFSPSAWVTSSIFLRYLLILNEMFKSQNRKTAVILDNCASHNVHTSDLTHIKLFFLPPNTTSIGQPLDAGLLLLFLFLF